MDDDDDAESNEGKIGNERCTYGCSDDDCNIRVQDTIESISSSRTIIRSDSYDDLRILLVA
jgi:hypothetical protein